MTRKITLSCLTPLLFWQCARSELALVDNVRLAGTVSESSVPIEFDLRWQNSFRNSTNWDAAWVFVKFRAGEGAWHHATLSSRPQDASVGDDNGVAATVLPATDGKGAFVFRTAPGIGPVHWDDVSVRWNHAADGVADEEDVSVRVFGVNMVYIRQGPFVVGDGEGGDVRGHLRGSTSALPFTVTDESAIVLGGSSPDHLDSNNGYGMYQSFGDDFGESNPVQLPASFPKGHRAFYVMKYEMTEGLYAGFLSTLNAKQLQTRNPPVEEPAARPGLGRYTITSTAPFEATVPDRAAHFLSWMDGSAFADWAALRPMTELEFEKASRGSAAASPGEFAWGTDEIHQRRYSLLDINTPSERIVNLGIETGNAAYDLTTGGAGPCWSCLGGPLKVAAFQTAGATRQETGASHYGVLGLSGNLVERTVSIGNSTGRRFDGNHGDGNLHASGNAWGPEVASWPGSSVTGANSQVIGAVGSGFRGGSWAAPAANLRISDREFAATPDNSRNPTFGYRFVRTAPTVSVPQQPDD